MWLEDTNPGLKVLPTRGRRVKHHARRAVRFGAKASDVAMLVVGAYVLTAWAFHVFGS